MLPMTDPFRWLESTLTPYRSQGLSTELVRGEALNIETLDHIAADRPMPARGRESLLQKTCVFYADKISHPNGARAGQDSSAKNKEPGAVIAKITWGFVNP